MPRSVVDTVFEKRAWDVAWGDDWDNAPTGMYGGGIHKSRAGGSGGSGGVSRLTELAQSQLLQSHARAADQRRTDKAVRALGIIEVCHKRLHQLSRAYHGPPRPAFDPFGGMPVEKDPDTTAAYEAERDRLEGLIEECRNELDGIFGEDVGPPLDLAAATAQREAARAAEAMATQEEIQMAGRMAGLTPPSGPSQPEQEPNHAHESPNAVMNPHFGGLSNYVNHGDYPPAFRSLGA